MSRSHERMSEKRQELTFKHFSHINHHLQLSYCKESKTVQNAAFCAACKLKASGWICSCKSCNYVLHFQCSIAPEKIHVHFHHAHALSLVPEQGLFKCHACGDQGFKFAYTCVLCNIYLHFDCARIPQVLTHQSHNHTLDLVCSPAPSRRKSIIESIGCDVCDVTISNCWRYSCHKCNFNAHIDCAKSNRFFDSSDQISSSSTNFVRGKESNYNYNPSSKVRKSSAETSYDGKEKGSNSRYQDDRRSSKGYGNRYGYEDDDSQRNRNKTNYGGDILNGYGSSNDWLSPW